MAQINKRKRKQQLLLEEIKKQLIIQAERWDRTNYYTPLKLEEMEMDQCRTILGNLLAEKANLEYELYMLETDKHEVSIKLEKIDNYLRKASQVIGKHTVNISKTIDKKIGDRKRIKAAVSTISPDDAEISILVGDN